MLELKISRSIIRLAPVLQKPSMVSPSPFVNKSLLPFRASGSGKTTMLNVIGGLDNYDSGDMIINGKSTKSFKDRDWDAYRNTSIGFVFQSQFDQSFRHHRQRRLG